MREGESVPNTQMALYVLQRAADLVEARDPALAAEIRGKVPALRARDACPDAIDKKALVESKGDVCGAPPGSFRSVTVCSRRRGQQIRSGRAMKREASTARGCHDLSGVCSTARWGRSRSRFECARACLRSIDEMRMNVRRRVHAVGGAPPDEEARHRRVGAGLLPVVSWGRRRSLSIAMIFWVSTVAVNGRTSLISSTR